MSLMKPEEFKDLHRILGTNVDGKRKVPFALVSIKVCHCDIHPLSSNSSDYIPQGIGRRFAFVICRKAGINPDRRMGELTNEEVDTITDIIAKPLEFKIPVWMLNRQKDVKDGKHTQISANGLDNKLREDLERMKKIKCHRGLRHYWGLRVRGQHTCTTGRRGRTVGVCRPTKK